MNTAEALKHRFDQLQQDTIERILSLMPTSNVEKEPIWVKFNVPVQVDHWDNIVSIKRVDNRLYLIDQEDEADFPIEDFNDTGTLIFIVGELEKADKGHKHNKIYEIITLED